MAEVRPTTQTPAPAPSAGGLYDADYYASHCGEPYGREQVWLEFFGAIAQRLVAQIRPGSVLDVGCASGLLVEALRERGVDAWGIDISEYALGQVAPAMRAFCRLAQATEPLGRRYDLIVCIEVVEHLTAEDGLRVIDNLCAHTDDIVFSSSPLDRDEPTHLNVQEPEIWATLFAERGFVRDVEFDGSPINAWAMRLRRSDAARPRLVHDYERLLWRLRQDALALARALGASEAERHASVRQLDAEIARQTQVIEVLLSSRALRLGRWLRSLIGR